MLNLVQAAEQFVRSYHRRNPYGEDAPTAFLRALSESGEMETYTEADWIEAGKQFGLSDNEIAAWIESAASWLVDTTGDGTGLEPAEWVEE